MVENEEIKNQSPNQKAQNKKDPVRPGVIKIFSVFVLFVSSYHLLQFILVVRSWRVISSLPLTLPPAFLMLEGLIWFITGLILFWGIWNGRNWGRPAGMIISLFYCLINWGVRIWSVPGAELSQRWIADLVFTLIGLGLATLALNHPASQKYFKEKAC